MRLEQIRKRKAYPISHPITEGTIPFKGYKTWYRIAGEKEAPGKLPLLCLHGGPGMAHDYLESLDALVESGRRVIYYDQIGSGNSHIGVSKPEMWSVELYVEELVAVRQALGLEKVHLLGQSWGGMLAMEYLFTRPPGVASVTFASSLSSMPQWTAECDRLREQLPPEVQTVLLKHEKAGTAQSQEYQAAARVFNDRHLCRLSPYPDFVQRTFDQMAKYPETYVVMNGPSEFHNIGKLQHWDVRHRLGEITIPALVTSGRYDEATPLVSETIHQGIPGSRWVIFENSSHMAHAEEADLYRQVLGEFLGQHEG